MIVRLVPATSLSLDDIQRLGARLSWTLRAVYPSNDSAPSSPFEQVWQAADGTVVNWIVDDRIRVSYFSLRGDDVTPTARTIRTEIEIYDQRGLFALWDGAEDYIDLGDAIRLVGVAAPESFDPTWFAYFQQAFANEFGIVRFWAVVVSAIAGWPELKEIVDRLAQADPEQHVRDQAAAVSTSPVWRN